MNIYEKLAKVQEELKAPKSQYNSFGKYSYRSCEDILEAVKPLLKETKATITLEDKLEYIGERYYIKAIAKFIDIEKPMLEDDEISVINQIINTAYAREEEVKKGMDGSQITGTASSYARKYALNGLLLIDDTKDADTDEFKKQTSEKKEISATEKQLEMIKNLFKDEVEELKETLALLNKTKINELTITEASTIIKGKKGE